MTNIIEQNSNKEKNCDEKNIVEKVLEIGRIYNKIFVDEPEEKHNYSFFSKKEVSAEITINKNLLKIVLKTIIENKASKHIKKEYINIFKKILKTDSDIEIIYYMQLFHLKMINKEYVQRTRMVLSNKTINQKIMNETINIVNSNMIILEEKKNQKIGYAYAFLRLISFSFSYVLIVT